tara:strand:- start:6059 stop:7717 length:1659 start_codon:yes stop_codon:yes gene_type:complete
MSEEVELKEVFVEGSFKDKFTALGVVSKVTMTAQCGEPSRVDLHLSGPNNKNQDVNVISSGAQLQAMLDANKKFQEESWSGTHGETETVELIVQKDGKTESKAVFTGVIASPGFSISSGQFASVCSLVHEDVQMESLDPSIYLRQSITMGTAEEPNKRLLNSAFMFDFRDGVRKQPLNKHIELLLQCSVENPNMNWKLGDPDKQKDNVKKNFEDADDICQEIHRNNKAQLKAGPIRGFLSRSTDTELQDDSGDLSMSVDLMGGPSTYECVCNPESYTEWICSAYGSSRNFYNFIMQTICPNYLLEYTCQIDGDSKVGHPQTDTKTPKAETVEIQSFSFNLGSRYQRSLGMVVCNGVSKGVTGMHENTNPEADMGAYPETVDPENGKIIHTERPPWFETIMRAPLPETKEEVKDNKVIPEGRNPEQRGQKDSKKAVDDHDKNFQGKGQNPTDFLKLWAEKQYRLWGLKNTTATVTLPLSLEWGTVENNKPIGKRYLIKAKPGPDGKGGSLFEGYLNRVVHNAAVGRDMGNASTILDFTHIKCVDVGKLGGLNE